MTNFKDLRILNPASLQLDKDEVLYLNFFSNYQGDRKIYSILIDSNNSCQVAIADSFYPNEWIYTLQTDLSGRLVDLKDDFLSAPKYFETLQKFNMSGNRPEDDTAVVKYRPSGTGYQIDVSLEFGEFNRMGNDKYANKFFEFLSSFRDLLVKTYIEINVVQTVYGATRKCYIKGSDEDFQKRYPQFSFQFNSTKPAP